VRPAGAGSVSLLSLRGCLLPRGWFPPFSLRGSFRFARRVRGRSAFARPRVRHAEIPPATTQQRVRRWGPLGVRRQPRHRHPTPDPHAGDPVASGEIAARTRRADLLPPPEKNGLWAGDQIRGCRGWQISPEPAGTGRVSHVGETAAQHHANAEGPRCGSRPPVAGEGVCGYSGWGDARPHLATRGNGKTKSHHAVDQKKQAAHPQGNKEAPRSGKKEAGSEPAGQQEASRSEKEETGREPARLSSSAAGRLPEPPQVRTPAEGAAFRSASPGTCGRSRSGSRPPQPS